MNCRKWYALHVRPTKELKVHSSLLAKGYESLLPLTRAPRHTRRGITEIRRAFFPGYLFCSLDLQENRAPLLFTPDVLGLVGSSGEPIPLQDAEIASIRQIADSGMRVQPWPYTRVGAQVQLVRGPLKGLSGIIVAHSKSTTHLVVSVELLQRSVAIEIPLNWAYPEPTELSVVSKLPTRTAS